MSNSELIQHEPRNEIAQVSPAQSFMNIVERVATMPDINMDALERMLNMQERIMARDAESAFNAAMAEMQCEIPTIAERAKGHGTIKYATLEDISDIVKPIMKTHGFAISFKVEHAVAGLSVTGILMHRAGHREQTTMLLPIDTSGSKNAVQAVGSSTSYGKRYVMCALLNITTRGEDDDAYSAVPSKQEPVITEIQVRQLKALLVKCSEKAQGQFNKLYPDVASIQRSAFDTVLNQLTTSAQKNAKAQEGEV